MDYESYLDLRTSRSTEADREALFRDAIARENEDRACFSRARDGWEVLGREDLSTHPHPSLVPMYDSSTGAVKREAFSIDPPGKEDADLSKRVFALDAKERAKLAGTCSVVDSLGEFNSTFFDVFCEGQLRYLKWDNVFAAGGGVLACATPIPLWYQNSMMQKRKYFHDIQYAASDVDLFLYGLNEEQARQKLVEIYNAVVEANPFPVVCFRSAHAVTLVSQYPCRHIQIVLRLYSSPYEILAGFDVDACTVGFDGKMVYADVRAHHALVTRRNTIDFTRRSPSYEMRLAKYGVRGFEVEVPMLKRDRVDPGIFQRPWNALEGLAKLLVLERLRSPEQRFQYFERQKLSRGGHSSGLRLAGFRGGLGNGAQQRLEDKFGGTAEVSNYSTVFLPWGPGITVQQIITLMERKDKMLNNRWFSRDRTYRLHPCFYGTAEEIIDDCSPDDPPFPERPPEGQEEDPLLKEHRETYVRGKITFIADDPGRQRIGSFHPLDEHGWADSVYFLDSTEEIFGAANADDVAKLKALLSEQNTDVNVRDFFGRTPLHLSLMAGSVNAVRFLLYSGANPMEPMAGRRTMFHLAALYNLPQVIPWLFEAGKKLMTDKAMEEAQGAQLDQKATKKIKNALTDWVRALETDFNSSALSFALFLGNYECVDALIAVGGSIVSQELEDAKKINPISLIPYDKVEEGVKCLVRNGFKCSAGYYQMENALVLSLRQNLQSVLEALIAHDPSAMDSINGIINYQGTYPLALAIENLNLKMIQTLLATGKCRLIPSQEDIEEGARRNIRVWDNSLKSMSHPAHPLHRALTLVQNQFMGQINYIVSSRNNIMTRINSDPVHPVLKQPLRERLKQLYSSWALGSDELLYDPDVARSNQGSLETELKDISQRMDRLKEYVEIIDLLRKQLAALPEPVDLFKVASVSQLTQEQLKKYSRRDPTLPWSIGEDIAAKLGSVSHALQQALNPRQTQNNFPLTMRRYFIKIVDDLSQQLDDAPYFKNFLMTLKESVLREQEEQQKSLFENKESGKKFDTTSAEEEQVRLKELLLLGKAIEEQLNHLVAMFNLANDPIYLSYGTHQGTGLDMTQDQMNQLIARFTLPRNTIQPGGPVVGTTNVGDAPGKRAPVEFPKTSDLFAEDAQVDAHSKSQQGVKQFLLGLKTSTAGQDAPVSLNSERIIDLDAFPWAAGGIQCRLFSLIARNFTVPGYVLTKVQQQLAAELYSLAYAGNTEALWPVCELGDLPITVTRPGGVNLLHIAVQRGDQKMFKEIVKIAKMQYRKKESDVKMKRKAAPRRIDNLVLMQEMDDEDGYDEDEYDDEDGGGSYNDDAEGDDSNEGEEEEEAEKKPPVPGSNEYQVSQYLMQTGLVDMRGTPIYNEVEQAIRESEKKFNIPTQTIPGFYSWNVLQLAVVRNDVEMVKCVAEELLNESAHVLRQLACPTIAQFGGGSSPDVFVLAVLMDNPQMLQLLLDVCIVALPLSGILDLLNAPQLDEEELAAMQSSSTTTTTATAAAIVSAKKKFKNQAVYMGYKGIMTQVHGAKKQKMETEKRNGSAAKVSLLPPVRAHTLLRYCVMAGSSKCYKFLLDGKRGSPLFNLIAKGLTDHNQEFQTFRMRMSKCRQRCPKAFLNAFEGSIEQQNKSVESDVEVVIRYLLGGSDLHVNAQNQTVLHLAVSYRTLEKLLNDGIVFSPQLLSRNYEEVQFEDRILFGKGDNLNELAGKSPLSLACSLGYAKEAEILIIKLGMDPNRPDAYCLKMRAFQVAINYRHFATAKTVAKYSVPETLLTANSNGITPLMMCAGSDQIDALLAAAEMCLKSNGGSITTNPIIQSVTMTDESGTSVIHSIAAKSSYTKVLKLLVNWAVEQEGQNWLKEDWSTGRTPKDLILDNNVALIGSNSAPKSKLDMVRMATSWQVSRVRAMFRNVKSAREKQLDAVGFVLGKNETLQKAKAMFLDYNAAWSMYQLYENEYNIGAYGYGYSSASTSSNVLSFPKAFLVSNPLNLGVDVMKTILSIDKTRLQFEY